MMATLLVAFGFAMFGNPLAYAQEKKPTAHESVQGDIFYKGRNFR
jgi:hypothetical protein